MKKGTFRTVFLSLLISSSLSFFRVDGVHAYIDVAGEFLDGEGEPITTLLVFRVSLWGAYDVRADDINEDGSLNTSALHYGGYQTILSGTPNQFGHFSFEVGPLPGFPVLHPFNSFLQLEYKNTGEPDTSYLIYDFLDDPPYQNVTRLLMDPNTVYYVSEAGPRTSWNTFILDANNNAPTAVVLQFGETLAKSLSYHLSDARFELDDDLSISGSLSSAGIISSGTVDFSAANVGIGTDSPQSALHVADGYYAQFSDSNAGAPPAEDCDHDEERGRVSIDTQNHRLYVCNGAVRGWDYSPLTD